VATTATNPASWQCVNRCHGLLLAFPLPQTLMNNYRSVASKTFVVSLVVEFIGEC
jgi:hypothetical protein